MSIKKIIAELKKKYLFSKCNKTEKPMYIIVGLGNPGRQYEHSRHNAGFEAIDRLAEKYQISIDNKKFQALCGTGYIDGQKVLLVKPQTYMNLSGESVRAACDFFKIDPEQELIVLYDDISLAPGHLRIRAKGSAGGHNGIKNMIQHLGTQTFSRVKIGVGEKPAEYDLADYVLGHFSKEEWPVMTEAFDRAAQAAAMMLTNDMQQVMNQFNTAKIKEEKPSKKNWKEKQKEAQKAKENAVDQSGNPIAANKAEISDSVTSAEESVESVIGQQQNQQN